jgi:hypothetical protein
MTCRLIVLTVVVVAAMVLAMPAGAGAQAPAGDSVTGSAFDCDIIFCATRSLTVDAQGGPAGANPTGTLSVEFIGPTPGSTSGLDADVSCLSVIGSVAVIGFSGFEDGIGIPAPVPTTGLIRVTDGGGPASGLDTFAVAITASGSFGDPRLPGPTDCSSFPPGSEVFVNVSGDLLVVDARSVPTSKDQCKKGGHRQFGFKNQGQCVAFVQRGPKP